MRKKKIAPTITARKTNYCSELGASFLEYSATLLIICVVCLAGVSSLGLIMPRMVCGAIEGLGTAAPTFVQLDDGQWYCEGKIPGSLDTEIIFGSSGFN